MHILVNKLFAQWVKLIGNSCKGARQPASELCAMVGHLPIAEIDPGQLILVCIWSLFRQVNLKL